MFYYMLVVFGIFAAGIVNALDKHLPHKVIAGLCFIASTLAVVFAHWTDAIEIWFGWVKTYLCIWNKIAFWESRNRWALSEKGEVRHLMATSPEGTAGDGTNSRCDA